MILKKFFKKIYDEHVIDKINFLSEISLFKNVKKRDIFYILDNIYERTYLKKEVLFSKGDIGRGLFILYKGKIGLFNDDKIIAEVMPGEFFGEMALLEEMPRTLDAVALENSTVFILYKTHIENMIKDKPKISAVINFNIAKFLSSRLRNLIENLDNEKKL